MANEPKQLRVVYHAYKKSKRVAGSKEFVFVKPLTSPVTFASVNAAMDETQDEAKEAIAKKHPDAYPVLYRYDNVTTDEVERCYCFTCKQRFNKSRVYGAILDDGGTCPQGHSNITSKNWGKCPECKVGQCWETKVTSGGVECMLHHYKCDTCGHTDVEPMD
jgi:hypothetical protein